MKRLVLLAILSSLLAGCCTVNTCNRGGHDMVEIENFGWRLLGFIPIASGDPEYPNQEVCVWFCDSVLLDVNMMLLDDEMRRQGARGVKDLVSYTSEEQIFPFIFKRKTYHTSAELIK